ncbi:MAG: hypothetical protein IPL23_08105 [Saprospiraceae bacterium]|nr:hypothetical protein [Saprospiraceae bacterium]
MEKHINDTSRTMSKDLKVCHCLLTGNDQLFAEGKAKEVAYEGNPSGARKLINSMIKSSLGKITGGCRENSPVELPVGINLGGKGVVVLCPQKWFNCIKLLQLKFLPSYVSLEAYFGVSSKMDVSCFWSE